MAITGDVDLHRVTSWDTDAELLAITHALGLLRGSRVTGLRLVLPVPGDLIGVPGPVSAAGIATQAGAAVVTVGDASAPALMFVPRVDDRAEGRTTIWQSLRVDPSRAPYGLPTLSEAERQLAESMTEATQALAALDVARGREDIGRELRNLERATEHLNLPASLPGRAQRMIAMGHRLLGIIEIARRSDGASVSAMSASLRRDALAPLDQSARHALCAAYSAQVEIAEIEKVRRGFSR
jgi:hypothetical protein